MTPMGNPEKVADALVADGLADGRVISRAWLGELLGLRYPETAHDKMRYDLAMLQGVSRIRAWLLENHRILLRPDNRGGLVVVPATEQTQVAMADGQKALKRAIATTVRGVYFVRTRDLDDRARRENADALAKLERLRSLVRQQFGDVE